MEMTLRTPYRTIFRNFIGFQRVYVNTIKGQMAISNRTPPVIYLLPAGEIKVTGMSRSDGNLSDATSSGEFVHSGGYAIVHE
jgi:F0F1-type ATP synthase epsilon subunit